MFQFHQSIFQKVESAGLACQDISVKSWNFDDPFLKKEPVLVIWVLVMIQPSGSGIFFDETGL